MCATVYGRVRACVCVATHFLHGFGNKHCCNGSWSKQLLNS